MSKPRAYSDESKGIMQRYFKAIDESLMRKRIKSVHSFCVNNGIVPEAFYRQRLDQSRGYFEVGWLVPLIRECNVSSTWLLTGTGSMFNI